MAGDQSFDVVSDFDEQELRNALDQAIRLKPDDLPVLQRWSRLAQPRPLLLRPSRPVRCRERE